jgi:Fur family ferric uptake transcriptional regulator
MTTRRALRDRFGAHLTHRGLRRTRQRAAILEALLGSGEHLTPEQVHRRVARRDPEIGLSTVYRTLRLLVEAEVASERHFRDGPTRYEARRPHHDHLVCLRCGRIEEFERAEIEAMQEEIARQHGFHLVSHRHELYGHCRGCRRR